MKNKNQAINEIKEILSNVKQMVICTSLQNKPWAATVLFACDAQLHLYFFSVPTTRHSKEIKKNKFIAGAIASEHKKGLEEPFHLGIQFEGTCDLIKKSELKAAYESYRKRHPKIIKFHSRKDASKELYKIKINKFVLFDTRKKKIKNEISWPN